MPRRVASQAGGDISSSILSNIIFFSEMRSSIIRLLQQHKILLRITLFSAGILPWFCNPLQAQTPGISQKVADSVNHAGVRAAARDSAQRKVDQQRLQFELPSPNHDPYRTTASMLFNSNATAPSEVLANSPICQSVDYGLSSQLNRFLVYGNPGPLFSIYPTGPLIGIRPGELGGTDGNFTTEFSQISLLTGGATSYDPCPGREMVPDGSFFWENGLFNEDIFTVRFMRPVSEQVSFGFFSNFRHFDATTFNHDGNSIFTFYQSLHTDTSQLSNQGYNPLTDEYSVGGRIRYAGSNGNEWSLGLRYTDCSNQLAVNATDINDNPEWELLHQFRSGLDFETSANRFGPLLLDVACRLESDNLSNLYPQAPADTSINFGGSNTEISGAGRAAVSLPDSGSAGLSYRATSIDRTAFDALETRSFENTPELLLDMPLHTGSLSARATAGAGYEILTLDSMYAYTFTWSMGLDVKSGGKELRLFARESALPYEIPYDSSLRPATPEILDRYSIAGAELSMQSSHAGLVVGGQAVQGVDSATVARSWPLGVPPYQQPSLVLLAAPSIGPWRGMTLTSRAMVSDRKPLLKAEASISFLSHPEDTREYIESRLSFDYWSPRDTLTYAGINTWNREIYNVNFEIASHIRTFRFFGKVDNILDRKFAYVPGYYSPGLTFRWGIAWYLQK